MKPWYSLTLAAVAATLVSPPAWSTQGGQYFVVTVDNDYFNFWRPVARRPDHDYTHGMRLAVGSSRGLLLARILARKRPPCRRNATARCTRSAIVVGQEIYAPRRDAILPIPGERPYAGWLYVGLREAVVDGVQGHFLSATVGITGKPSLAEAVQKTYHEIAGFRPPLGWDNQLPFEPGMVVRYDYRHLLASVPLGPGHLFTLAPLVGAALGNVETEVHTGVDLGFGWNVSHPWARSADARPAASLYGRLRARGDLVVRNLFLDGSTFTHSVSVDKEMFVPEVQVALILRVGDMTMQYAVTTRGREYRTQENDHTFSSLTLGLSRAW